MKRSIGAFVVFCLLTFNIFANQNPYSKKTYTLPEGITTANCVPNTLVIKYKDLQTATIQQSLSSSNSSQKKYSGIEIISQTAIYPNISAKTLSYKNQVDIDKNGINRIYKVNYQSKKSLVNVINTLLEDTSIEYVEPMYIRKVYDIPNDPDYINNLQNSLNIIKAQDAWQVQNDANGTVIAIIDSGSEITHPDLAANIYTNINDPIDGIDNDGDGYIDNYYGWDFSGATATSGGDNDPNAKSSSADHGIHVSGIASAVTNNGIGVASVAKNAKLMILKAGPDSDGTSIYHGYQAILYAADRGVKIINCSWGGAGKSAFEQNIIDYAVSKGCLVVCAAGNSNEYRLEYPAGYNGVFAVANLNDDDSKAFNSSYGLNVAISAPGRSIWNTSFNGTYTYKSGTSMATPLVSSAAALIAAKYPNLTGVQIGEILKATTDDIYSVAANANYINLLGTGRLNVYKALTYSAMPSIKKQNIIVANQSSSFAAQDTLELYFDIKNILTSATNVQVTLSSESSAVNIINNLVSAGNIATDEQKNIGPFKVYINTNVKENEEVVFKLNYASTEMGYSQNEYFSLKLNLDYLNYSNNYIKTTITSNGRVGFSKKNAEDGTGLIYKNESLLYEAALMIGDSPTRVSNNARGVSGTVSDDFVKKSIVKKVSNNNAFEALSVFNDNNSTNPLQLDITNTHLMFNSDKFFIVDYDIKNGGLDDLQNVHAGLFVDWDITTSDKNITKYNQELKMAYAYSSTDVAPYVGVKLLNEVVPQYYPLSYQIPGDLLEEDDFTVAEKFETLSSGIKQLSLGENYGGVDIMYVIGSGAYNIPKNSSIKVSFAFVVGDDLADLETSAKAAQLSYNTLNDVAKVTDFKLIQNYPNPVTYAQNQTTIELLAPKSGKLNLALYNVLGKEIKTMYKGNISEGKTSFTLSVNNLTPGVYFCTAIFNDKIETIKLLVQP